MSDSIQVLFFFFFNDTATTEIYTLSLHDALPIYVHIEQDEVELIAVERREGIRAVTGGFDLVGVLVPEQPQCLLQQPDDGLVGVDDENGLGRARGGKDHRVTSGDLQRCSALAPSPRRERGRRS